MIIRIIYARFSMASGGFQDNDTVDSSVRDLNKGIIIMRIEHRVDAAHSDSQTISCC